MKYAFPPGFDLNRALELGTLVNCAYTQLDQGKAWVRPAGYTIIDPTLTAKEFWKIPGVVSDLLEKAVDQLFPAVSFGFVATKGSDIFVVIRGTKTPLEWLDDFTAKPVPFTPGGKSWGNTTHGFNLLYAYLGPQIIQVLRAYKAAGGALGTIYVTGHSLGAALAHLAAAGIYAEFGIKPISYTFCGPRAGDPPFAQAFATAGLQTWRMFNTEDIVPTVPPAAVKMRNANMGMHGMSPLTQALNTFVLLSQSGYQHVGVPVAATCHYDVVADNHSLDYLCKELQAK